MTNNDLKAEVLIVSKYCFVIKQILCVHKQLSVIKTMFFAYLLKNDNNYFSALFKGNNSNNLVLKSISQLSGNYSDYCINIPYIVESIHLLIEGGSLIINNSILLYNEHVQHNEKYNNKFLQKAIKESENYSDRQFLREIISNV